MDKKGQKRQGYLSWDEYFMGVAMLSGMRSKDPHSQVGACIVSEDNKILSMYIYNTGLRLHPAFFWMRMKRSVSSSAGMFRGCAEIFFRVKMT